MTKKIFSFEVPNVSPIGPSLKVLTLSDNNIISIPEEHLSAVTKLRQLTMKSNQLSSIANISGKLHQDPHLISARNNFHCLLLLRFLCSSVARFKDYSKS